MANVQAVNLDAELKAAQALKAGPQTQAGTKGWLKNETKWTLKFDKSHDWDGCNLFDKPYPPVIQPNEFVYFIHIAHSTNGCKEAFLYQTTCGRTPNAYLVAYHAPHNLSGCNKNKVYVECGSADKFKNINWSELEKKLDGATHKASYTDKCTGTFINAEIDGGLEFASLGVRYGETA